MGTTPDTSAYMIAGYVVFSVVMVTYLVSLYTRWHKLVREQQMLDETAKK